MRLFRLCLILVLMLWGTSSHALRVTFINPGHADESFWSAATQAMQSAASSLRLELEVLYAKRDPATALRLARELTTRPSSKRPDYVLLVNDKGSLVPCAQLLGQAGIKSFAAFSGLLPQERKRWQPRKTLPLLLGSLEASDREAGLLTSEALISKGLKQLNPASDGRLHLVAVVGDRSTPVAVHRYEGLRAAMARNPQVEFDGTLVGNWRREDAAEQVAQLLKKHPSIQLIWAGNERMAFGAIDALRAAERQPGKDVLVSAIHSSREAVQALQEGTISTLAGGNFMAGAWALVMLYDHHKGHDFVDEGLESVQPMFMLFERPDAAAFLSRFGAGVEAMDFSAYSKQLNPRIKRYNFSLATLLR